MNAPLSKDAQVALDKIFNVIQQDALCNGVKFGKNKKIPGPRPMTFTDYFASMVRPDTEEEGTSIVNHISSGISYELDHIKTMIEIEKEANPDAVDDWTDKRTVSKYFVEKYITWEFVSTKVFGDTVWKINLKIFVEMLTPCLPHDVVERLANIFKTLHIRHHLSGKHYNPNSNSGGNPSGLSGAVAGGSAGGDVDAWVSLNLSYWIDVKQDGDDVVNILGLLKSNPPKLLAQGSQVVNMNDKIYNFISQEITKRGFLSVYPQVNIGSILYKPEARRVCGGHCSYENIYRPFFKDNTTPTNASDAPTIGGGPVKTLDGNEENATTSGNSNNNDPFNSACNEENMDNNKDKDENEEDSNRYTKVSDNFDMSEKTIVIKPNDNIKISSNVTGKKFKRILLEIKKEFETLISSISNDGAADDDGAEDEVVEDDRLVKFLKHLKRQMENNGKAVKYYLVPKYSLIDNIVKVFLTGSMLDWFGPSNEQCERLQQSSKKSKFRKANESHFFISTEKEISSSPHQTEYVIGEKSRCKCPNTCHSEYPDSSGVGSLKLGEIRYSPPPHKPHNVTDTQKVPAREIFQKISRCARMSKFHLPHCESVLPVLSNSDASIRNLRYVVINMMYIKSINEDCSNNESLIRIHAESIADMQALLPGFACVFIQSLVLKTCDEIATVYKEQKKTCLEIYQDYLGLVTDMGILSMLSKMLADDKSVDKETVVRKMIRHVSALKQTLPMLFDVGSGIENIKEILQACDVPLDDEDEDGSGNSGSESSSSSSDSSSSDDEDGGRCRKSSKKIKKKKNISKKRTHDNSDSDECMDSDDDQQSAKKSKNKRGKSSSGSLSLKTLIAQSGLGSTIGNATSGGGNILSSTLITKGRNATINNKPIFTEEYKAFEGKTNMFTQNILKALQKIKSNIESQNEEASTTSSQSEMEELLLAFCSLASSKSNATPLSVFNRMGVVCANLFIDGVYGHMSRSVMEYSRVLVSSEAMSTYNDIQKRSKDQQKASSGTTTIFDDINQDQEDSDDGDGDDVSIRRQTVQSLLANLPNLIGNSLVSPTDKLKSKSSPSTSSASKKKDSKKSKSTTKRKHLDESDSGDDFGSSGGSKSKKLRQATLFDVNVNNTSVSATAAVKNDDATATAATTTTTTTATATTTVATTEKEEELIDSEDMEVGDGDEEEVPCSASNSELEDEAAADDDGDDDEDDQEDEGGDDSL